MAASSYRGQAQKRGWKRFIINSFLKALLIGLSSAATVALIAPANSKVSFPLSSVSTAINSQQISYPPGTTLWLLQYLVALIFGVLFLAALDKIISRRQSPESLAKEVSRLRRLVIGYPDGMIIFEQLRSSCMLEKRLASLGLAIEWRQYPSASSLLNDLSQGSIHFCGGGGTASIFSQAANHFFVRVAREKYPEIDSEAILVPLDSTITNLVELRDKRIAFDEGSSAHYVLVRALESAGISMDEIEPCMLPQRDVLSLFVSGLVDAWVVWMPYALTDQRRSYPGRSIGNLYSILGEKASHEVPTLYYAVPELVSDYPRILKAILEELNEAGVLINLLRLENCMRQQASSAKVNVHPSAKTELEFLRQRSLERSLVPIDEPALSSLQQQADLFHRLGIIGERVNVRDSYYTLRTRQNWTF
jgi:sulfonate transport system substrate-binding protein